MSAQLTSLALPAERETDIEELARETHTPVAIVHEIYRSEHAKLDETAKIKTFVPVLLRRRVKELLRTNRRTRNADLLTRSPPKLSTEAAIDETSEFQRLR